MKKAILALVLIAALSTAALLYIQTIKIKDIPPVEDPDTELPVENPETPDSDSIEDLLVEQPEKPETIPPKISEPEKSEPLVLYQVDIEEILTVEFQSAGQKLLFTRTGSSWTINQGKVDMIDFGKVHEIISSIVSLESLETVPDKDSDRAKQSITENSPRVNIQMAGETIQLHFSLVEADENSYVSIAGRNSIYRIKNSVADLFKPELDDIRQRTLNLWNNPSVTSLIMDNGEDIIEIVPYRKSDVFTADHYLYMLEQPYSAQLPIDNDRFADLIKMLSDPLQIIDFIDNTDASDKNFEEHRAYIKIKEQSGREVQLTIAEGSTEDSVIARTSESGQVFTLQKEDLVFLTIKPFDLIDRNPHRIPMEHTEMFLVTSDDLALVASTHSPGEESLFDINGFEVNRESYTDLFRLIQSLEISGENNNGSGYENADIVISYKHNDGGSLWTHLNLYRQDTDDYAIGRNDDPPLFTVPAKEVELLKNNLIKRIDSIMGF